MSKKSKWLSVSVGKLLATRRTELRLTQAQVAKSLRIQRTSVSNIESGKQVLLLDVFYDICQVLKTSPVAILDNAVLGISEGKTPYEEIENVIASVDNK